MLEQAAQLRDAVNGDGAGPGTLYSNPIGPVFDFARKALGFTDEYVEKWKDLGRALNVKQAGKEIWRAEWGRVPRVLMYSNQGRLLALEKIRKSPAIGELRRLFDPEPGRAQGSKPTFGEDVDIVHRAYENRLNKVLQGVSDQDLAQITKLVQNRGNIRPGTPLHDKAEALGDMLDELRTYQKDAGLELGEVREGYFPRVLDNDAISSNPQGFEAAAAKAYQAAGLSPQEAKEAASAWRYATQMNAAGISENPFVDLPSIGVPNQKFSRPRELPKEADEILRPFLVQDPGEVLSTYIRRAVSRAEFERRLGGTVRDADGNIITRTAKWDALRDKLTAEGNQDLIPQLEGTIRSMIGRPVNSWGPTARGAASWAQALTVAQYLKRAALSSLTEPTLAAVRTGRGRDFFQAYRYTLSDIASRAGRQLEQSAAKRGVQVDASWLKSLDNAEQAREAAELLGSVVSHYANDSIVMAQAGGIDEAGAIKLGGVKLTPQKVANKATLISGLRTWTDSTRVGMSRTAQGWLGTVAKRYLAGTPGAEAHLRELGFSDPAEMRQFSQWVDQTKLTPDKINLSDPMVKRYAQAVNRIVDGVIMSPKGSDKPKYAADPVGRLAYSLLSYQYAMQQNVLNRVGRMVRRAATDGSLTAGDRARLLAPLAYMSLIPLIQYGLIPVRDAMTGRPEEKRKESASTPAYGKNAVMKHVMPDWWTQDVDTSFSRGGMYGAADPWLQMITSARYERRPETTLLGPVGGNVSSLIFHAAQGVSEEKNAPTNNTAERQLAKDFYNAVIDPAMSVAITALPTPLGVVAANPSLVGVSPEEIREGFVSGVAGEKKAKKSDKKKGSDLYRSEGAQSDLYGRGKKKGGDLYAR